MERLERMSTLGRSYLHELRAEVKRLMLTAEESLDGALVETMAEKLDEPELRQLKQAYGAKAARKLGLGAQLAQTTAPGEQTDESDFCI